MLFNSYQFTLLFLPITVALFFAARRPERAQLILIVASMFFYAYWSEIFLLLILAGVVINYFISRYLLLADDKCPRKAWLVTGIVINLTPLVYFKYSAFLVEIAMSIGSFDFHWPRAALPLAISFYTFQKIVLLVQSYRREVPDVRFRSYCLFIIFFPHLIAGPITSARELLPQFEDQKTYHFRSDNFALGLSIFIVGLCKKLLIADVFAIFSGPVFAAADHGVVLTASYAWLGALFFTFQLYFDFSGYSDMAVGLARMFNIRMPINFFSPYKAISIADFWRRWHMSLSWFLREYVYIPMGGNRQGKARQLINLFTTMVIAGIWHGAGWTFILFGMIHGVALAINAASRMRGIAVGGFAGWAMTFITVVIGWVFFRAETMAGAFSMLEAMSDLRGFRLDKGFIDLLLENWQALALLALGFLVVLALPNTTEIFEPWRIADLGLREGRLKLHWRATATWAAVASVVAIACLLRMQTYSEFLYFNF